MKKIVAKPFIKWVGGKGQLIPTFEELLPAGLAEINDLTYIEPFIGGGAMLFFMLQRFENINKVVVNDINPKLIIAYRTVKMSPHKLVDGLSDLQLEYDSIVGEDAKKEFYLFVRKKFNEEVLTDVETTSCLIFLNKTCFNGLYRVNSKGKFNVPFGKYKNPTICDADTIYADSELLQNVEILNTDFEQTEKYVTKKLQLLQKKLDFCNNWSIMEVRKIKR